MADTSPAPYDWRAALAGHPVSLDDLWVRQDSKFVAGSLQVPALRPLWTEILEQNPERELIHGWLAKGFDLECLWTPYRGRFMGKQVESQKPVRREFANHPSTEPFTDWIDAEITKGIQSGAMARWPTEWGAPKVIHPLGIEPEKPRLIYDCRYANLWLPDRPFRLPHVRDVGSWVSEVAGACDDKSGFYHCLLSENSLQYMAFRWRDKLYYYRVLPFGMKLSPWVYQRFSEAPVLFLRRKGIRSHVYIDDALISPAPGAGLAARMDRDMFIFADLRSRLGWFLSREKSTFQGQPVLQHLGIVLDFLKQEWRVPDDKIRRFKARIRRVLEAQPAPLVSELQHVAGNIAFFAVAVPSAMLFARSLFALIAEADRKHVVRRALSAEAREDLRRWLELDDSWNGISWRGTDHTVLDITVLHTDASLVQWAGRVLAGPPNVPRVTMGDGFAPDDAAAPIHVLEILGLRNAVCVLAPVVGNGRIRAFCDNAAVVAAFNGQGKRDPRLNRPLTELFDLQFRHGFSLSVEWVPSAENEADAPSRDSWFQEGRLSPAVFKRAQQTVSLAGPFTVDLMASAWNTRCTRYYSRFRSPSAAGLDIFAQDCARDTAGRREHGWCNPPFVMVQSVLDHLLAQRATFTIVVPERIEAWWPVLRSAATWSSCIAHAGDRGVVEFPPGMHRAQEILKETLWAFLVVEGGQPSS